jgi:hypothetical protein
MDLIIGLLMIANGVIFIYFSKRPNAPEWFQRVGIGLVIFGTIAAVGRLVFMSGFQG